MKVFSKVGATQEHVKKALDLKSSIESTVSRIHKLNIVSVTESGPMVTAAEHGEWCYNGRRSISTCYLVSSCHRKHHIKQYVAKLAEQLF